MTTDITELAQREKFEAWFKSSFHPDKTGPYIKDQLYFAWKAAGAELVEALEKVQEKIIELQQGCEIDPRTHEIIDLQERIIETNDVLCNLLPDCRYMDPPDGGSVTPLEQVSRMVADYRQRIDGLEASHTKLRESMAAIHNTIRLDGASTSLGVIMNAAKRAYEESTSAAGIKWEAE